MTPIEWYAGTDTGISSMSMFLVMMGLIPEPSRCDGNLDIPRDSSDFGRCHRMLSHFPEWRSRLDEVAIKLPKWRPLIERWPELEALYANNQAQTLNLLLDELYPICMAADGWKKTGPASWTRSAR